MANKLFIRIDIRSSLSFAVFAIIAVSTTIFLLVKAEQAIDEIQKLSNARVYFGAKDPKISSDIDVSTWKTYRNEKYGFEVKYPSDWKIVSPSLSGSRTVLGEKFEGSVGWIEIYVESNPKKEPVTPEWFKEWVTSTTYVSQGFDAEDTTFRNNYALKINSNTLFFTHDMYVFRIHWNYPDMYSKTVSTKDNLTGQLLLDQILSTFKFIK